jgi:heme-degrading monooxygenase HmoA
VAQAFTHTIWIVKPGLEDDFVLRWNDLARWSVSQGLSASARLLRDVDDPSRFVSFGPWQSLQAARRWRGTEGFNERIQRLQEVLDGFQPCMLEEVGAN